MKAKDIMSTDVPTISMRKTVAEAVRLLKSNYGDDSFRNAAPGLIVVNERGDLAGLVTPLLIITELLKKAKLQPFPGKVDEEYLTSLCGQIRNLSVESVMERQAISVTEEALITDVANLFATHRFQRVPVVRGKKVVGIIYRARLMFAMTACLSAE
jgi:predicted transcriptional regulator